MSPRSTKNWKLGAVHAGWAGAGCLAGATLADTNSLWTIFAVGLWTLSATAAMSARSLPKRWNYGYGVAFASGTAGGAIAVLLLALGMNAWALAAAVILPLVSSSVVLDYLNQERRRNAGGRQQRLPRTGTM